MVDRRTRKNKCMGKTVSLVLRDNTFSWLGRFRTLTRYTDLAEDLYAAGLWLLDQHWGGVPVRMVGLSLAGLVSGHPVQSDIFSQSERLGRLARACDSIRNRFGEKVIKRASSLTRYGVAYE